MAKPSVKLPKNPKVVVIGGGTGLSTFLRGLKEYTKNITAIVTVADDGGGSGKIREDMGLLPPGDIRNCLLALSNVEPSMEKLFMYRYNKGDLKGQNFGNLFIATMNEVFGNFYKAIDETSNILAVTGRVLPMTLDDVKLCAELESGELVVGESIIPKTALDKKSPIKRVFLQPEKNKPLKEAIDAIMDAELISLGPGSLYTSIIPNLLVEEIKNAILESKAIKLYNCNIMTQPGETDGYSVLDHMLSIERHMGTEFIEAVSCNSDSLSTDLKNKYLDKGAKEVFLKNSDKTYLKNRNITIIEDKFLKVKDGLIRHDSLELSKLALELLYFKSQTKIYRKNRKNMDANK